MVKIKLRREEEVIYKDILEDDPHDRAFVDIIVKISEYTMTLVRGLENPYALFKSVQYIVEHEIPGNIVECGVWRGGSIMLAALALKHFGDESREIYLYDTFQGLTRPEEVDLDWDGNDYRPDWDQAQTEGRLVGFGGDIEEVRPRILSTGYDEDKIIFVKGPVEETIPGRLPGEIAILRLDTDWYSSTRHELEHLYPHVSTGGILILDDYGWSQGVRKATDEYFAQTKEKIFLSRIDGAVRLAVKTA